MTLSKEQIDAIVAEEARWREAHSALIRAAHKTGDDMLENRATAASSPPNSSAAKGPRTRPSSPATGGRPRASKLRRRLTGDYETLAKQPYFARWSPMRMEKKLNSTSEPPASLNRE